MVSGLQSQLARIADKVFRSLRAVETVAPGGLQSQLQLQLVVEAHFLFVVVVGLYVELTQYGVVALAALIPV